jgi:hypothetical protein
VVVGDEIERRVVLVLQVDELPQRAEVVAEMKMLARGLRAREDDLGALRRRGLRGRCGRGEGMRRADLGF